MASRRVGGMGGPQRGNRSFSQHQPFQGGNVSPWQGNVPSNNSVNQGLISQITNNPQLALALTSLLHPQQQQMNNPPSLLSLNTSPAFSNQDRDLNRFGNRGRDFRRHEPYSKNRNGGSWRPMDGNRNRNRNRKNSPSKDKKKDGKNEKNATAKDEKKVDTIDLSVEENRDDDGTEEGKRDWKAEKNNDKTENEADDEKKKGDPKARAGKYFDVPVKFLNCFVCNKEMWDGESMQKHIKGRAHKQMLSSLEESIHITVNILRENMRLTEEKKVIEWNRIHRLKKFPKFSEPESHCNMCDLKFLGKIITHRKTDGHQRLKRYLHPNCNICSKEFPSRIEWVEHRLTPDHLRKLNEVLEAKEGGIDGAVIAPEEELDLEPLLEESLQMESENPVLELTDDLAGLQNLIPAYKKDRAVSTKSLIPFTGFLCELCNRSFDKEELAQGHLKSRKHYYAFIEAAKAKYQKHTEEARKKSEAEAENKDAVNESQNGDEDMYDPEEACNEEDASMEAEKEEDTNEETKKEDESMEQDVEETEPEVKEEPTDEEETPTRATRRNTVNKPGPKSKKLATSPAAATKQMGEQQSQARPKAVTSSFRIPKIEGAKGGALPKNKKPQTK